MNVKLISLFVMALFYMVAGANHFLQPKFYLQIIPPILPFPELINYVSGAVEIGLGVGLIIAGISKSQQLESYMAWGVILLLIAVFPANIYHLWAKGAGMNVPIWSLWLRLPFQFLFIAWAYWHTS
jgi:uncharacterized membrane protein